MSAYKARNGVWVVRNGRMLGFGETEQAAWGRAGAGPNPMVTDISLSGDEWDALVEFIKGEHSD